MEDEAREVMPATVTVHWPNGPINLCEDHGIGLVGLGSFMGAHVAMTQYDGDDLCINCVNAAKKKTAA